MLRTVRGAGGLLAVGLSALALAAAGCADEEPTDTGGGGSTSEEAGGFTGTTDGPTTELVEVPDVIGMDGQEGYDEIESADLSPTFDDGRSDGTGCTVEDQDETGEVEPDTEVILTLDCRQVDWDNQEGEDWEAFADAYDSGWDTGCSDVFLNNTPDGSLYTEDEQEYTDLDCPAADDASDADVPTGVPDDPEYDGDALGQTDGCTALFEDVAYYEPLYSSDQVQVDDSVCP